MTVTRHRHAGFPPDGPRPAEPLELTARDADRDSGAASDPQPRRGDGRGWGALAAGAFLAAALAAGPFLPAWGWMWTLVLALCGGAKALTLAGAPVAPLGRKLAYVFLWPGLDARAFLTGGAPPRPRIGEAVAAVAKIALGAALVWGAARHLPPLAAGWAGMAGLVLILHCGLAHAVSIAWRAAGVDARPLMHAPLLSRSVVDFWSGRWNRAFTDLCRDVLVRPLRRRGASTAALAVFLVSGLAHELVISLPARAGWGLPTAYFLVNGLAVLAERSPRGRRLGLDRGLAGRLFAFALVALPAFALFHPVFVDRVALPMLRALGALSE